MMTALAQNPSSAGITISPFAIFMSRGILTR